MNDLPAVITNLPRQLKASFVDIVRDKLKGLNNEYLKPIVDDAKQAVDVFANRIVESCGRDTEMKLALHRALAPDAFTSQEPVAGPVVSDSTTSFDEGKFIDIWAHKLGVPRSKITDETKMSDYIKADSLDLVELVMEFEDKFGIRIPDSDYGQLGTVASFREYIKLAQ